VAKAPKALWVCRECGGDHAKWQGQCAHCQGWNCLEELQAAGGKRGAGWAGERSAVTALASVRLDEAPRRPSGIKELDRVLGGGFVAGSVVLLAGSPGAGKSTVLLQVSCALAERASVLYVTGEESLTQLALVRSGSSCPGKNYGWRRRRGWRPSLPTRSRKSLRC
jgi:DNA repair protein RadA/Sms